MFKRKTTQRGFGLIEFTDHNGNECSIQNSSSMEECMLWLGVDKPRMCILAKDAHKVGIKTEETTGWVDYEIHEDVFINSRMHLTIPQAECLVKELQKFIDDGEV